MTMFPVYRFSLERFPNISSPSWGPLTHPYWKDHFYLFWSQWRLLVAMLYQSHIWQGPGPAIGTGLVCGHQYGSNQSWIARTSMGLVALSTSRWHHWNGQRQCHDGLCQTDSYGDLTNPRMDDSQIRTTTTKRKIIRRPTPSLLAIRCTTGIEWKSLQWWWNQQY